jgi:FtsP/CotA-like multicopper oxidase with cupredoxin domain
VIWLLLACTNSGDDVDSMGIDETAVDTEDTAVDTAPPERPTFANPTLAEDQNPDPGIFELTLSAAPQDFQVAGQQVSGYAYNGQNPGPLIQVEAGDTLTATLDNGLEIGSTIHWHGASVPWAMDGVPWMIDPVQAGESKTYTFELTEPITGWYHPHFDTERQVDLGLYGVLLVKDPAWPVADHELVLVADSWGEAPEEGHHAGFVFQENTWTINGLESPVLQVEAGESVVAHILNVSNMGYLSLSAEGMRVVGGEQGLLPAPTTPERLVLGPGDRAIVEFSPGTQEIELLTHPYSVAGASELGEPVSILGIHPSTSGTANPGLDWPFQSAAPTQDPGQTAVRYVFQGDEQTGQWRINGEAFPDVTIHSLPEGEPAVIEVRNLSATEHPFHLHGMAFEVLSIDGVPPDQRTIEDTVNIGIRQTVRLLIPADNVGDWMAHCHILPHAEGGMMTVLRVE